MEDVNHNMTVSDATHLRCQVAGHSAKKGSLGFLEHKDGYVLKPVFKNQEQGRRELEFYEDVKNSHDPVVKELQNLIPKYFGTAKLKAEEDDVRWIVLKNVTHEFREPCIMDVKIGARTWDPLATEEKRATEEAKYRDCKRDLGFCIPGFQVYKLPGGELVKRDRNYGKTLDGKAAIAAIKMFLNSEFGASRSLLLQFLAKLWKILRWFRTQKKYQFYSSSLLLAYDAAKLRETFERGENSHGGAPGAPRIRRPLVAYEKEPSRRKACAPSKPSSSPTSDDWRDVLDKVCRTHSLVNNYDVDLETMKENYKVALRNLVGKMGGEHPEVWVNVNMIDFAHVFRTTSEEIDRNYLDGLENLVYIFEEFLAEADV